MYYNCKMFGEELVRLRKKLNYSQKTLAKLTDVHADSLRRIENGKVLPSRGVLELLSIPLKTDLNRLLLNYRLDNNFEYDSLKSIIERKLEEGNYKFLDKDLDKLKLILDSTSNNTYIYELMKQFYLLVESVHLDVIHNNLPASLTKLEEAIKITSPQFNINNYSNYVYSKIEVRILMNIALCIGALESEEKSRDILLFCLKAIDENENEYKVKILYNLSYSYHRLSQYEKSLEYAEKGINICESNKSFQHLALLYTRRGVAKHLLKIDGSKNDLTIAKYLHDLSKEDNLKSILIKFSKELYNIDL